MDSDEDFEDLLTACIHEAGHVVVAKHFGLTGEVEIVCNHEWAPGQRRFGGSMWLPDALETLLPDPDQSRLVRLAGLAAEALDSGQECTGKVLYDCVNGGHKTLSESDAKSGYSAGAFDDCLVILRGNWRTVRAYADILECPGNRYSFR